MLQSHCKGIKSPPKKKNNQKKTQKKSKTCNFFIWIDYEYNVRRHNLDYFMEDIMEHNVLAS